MTFKIQYNIVNYSQHVLHYILRIIYLIMESLYLLITFTHFPHIPLHSSGNHQSVLCFYEVFVCLFVFIPYKWDQTVFIFLWFISLSVCPQDPPMLWQKGGFPYFSNWIIFHISIHLYVDEHLGCFYVLAILNNAEMNMRLYISLQHGCVVSFRYIPRSGVAR